MFQLASLKNCGFYILVFGLSLIYLLFAVKIGHPVQESRLSPSFFPLILGSTSVIISFVLLIKEFKKKQPEKNEHSSTETTNKIDQYRTSIVVAVTIIYILLFQKLGFFISSIPYVLTIIIVFSSLEKIIQKLIYAALITVIGYLIFAQLFNVRLPSILG